VARSRNIKPGFFLNDELAECDPLARLLFAGLWCIADREGRLEDRPKRIKAEVLPYDDCDVDQLLDQLAERDFIVRYEVDGLRYIQIINFSKHQNPHKNEKDSEIPAPDLYHTSTVQVPEKHSTNPADSLNLIPDSLNHDDDSLSTRTREDDVSVVDNGFKLVVDAFNKNIHPITPVEAEKLKAWLDDGMEPDVLVFAIEQAALAGNRSASYINGILLNLHSEGITTRAQAEARERDYIQRKRQGKKQDSDNQPRAPAPKVLTAEEKQRIKKANKLIAELSQKMVIPDG